MAEICIHNEHWHNLAFHGLRRTGRYRRGKIPAKVEKGNTMEIVQIYVSIFSGQQASTLFCIASFFSDMHANYN
jgi:hypothetical protein